MDYGSQKTPVVYDGAGWLIDTHAHLADPTFDSDREMVLSRAASKGVHLIVATGADMDSSRRSLDLARRTAGIVATVGIHPHDAAQATALSFDELRQLAADPRVVAVGETGLDYYRMHSPSDTQRRALAVHLAIADEMDKPVVIHDRDAHEDLLAIILPWAERRRKLGKRSAPGVLHCFSGDLAMAEKVVAAGFFLGFGGTLTYSGATALADVARQIDPGAVVLETDSPYLTPLPLRGRRNEPSNIVLVAKRLADLRASNLAAIANQSTANARRLFGMS